MANNTPSNDYEKLLNALDDLFSELLMKDIDEVDAILREAGYDPDEVGTSLEAAAKHAIAQSPSNWRNRARREIEDAQTRLNKISPPKHTRSELMETIRRLLSTQQQPAAAHFRNFEKLTDADLEKMIAELEYLAAQQRYKRNDEE